MAARKSLGQHFIFDSNLTRKIVRGAGDVRGASIVEIGPGPGILTESLLETDAEKIIAVERDPRFVKSLQTLVAGSAGALAGD